MKTDPGSVSRMVREQHPLVQCITNYVSMDIAANLLNAAGASAAGRYRWGHRRECGRGHPGGRGRCRGGLRHLVRTRPGSCGGPPAGGHRCRAE